MKRNRIEVVRQLFAGANAQPEELREAFVRAQFPLGDAVADAEIQAEVLALLAAPPLAEGAIDLGSAEGVFAEESEHPERFGRYVVYELLGRGAMGTVSRAHDSQLRRDVALKRIQPHLLLSAAHLARFQREAIAASRLDHPGLCQVHDVGEIDGTPYLVMQLYLGQSLADRIESRQTAQGGGSSSASRSRVELEEAVHAVEQIARALHHAHEAGLTHRDVKPANVLIQDQGPPVVLDFGLVQDSLAEGESLTQTGQHIGSPAYMSPEQVEGLPTDRTTDVYSLGVTLFEWLAGQRPFEAASRHELFERIRTQPAPGLRKFNRLVSRDLGVVVETAMAKEPARRYATMQEFADDLGRVRRLEPIRARRTGPVLAARGWVLRNPLATAFIASMAVALLALWLEFQRAERQSRRAASAAEAARESDAESRVRLAEAHGRRGDWHKVLDAVDAARALGHDSVRLAIEEAQAFEATFRFDRAKAVLAGLLERTDLGRSRAKVELLLADLDVHRIEDPEQNLDRVQAALDSGDLDPADREFALALLARDTREARRHLELALQRDGDHRRASDMYANLLLAMGDLEACRSFATVMVSRFPRDFLAVGFAAFIARIDGDSQRAERLLLRAREFGGERGEPYVELLVDCADLIRSAGKALLEAQGEAEFGVFQKVTRLLTRASGVVRERGGGVFRFPPVVARLFGGKITRAPRETRLESVAHNLHNGALLLLAGQLRLLVGDYDRAEEFLVAARDAPSFLVGRAYCSRMLVLCLRLRIERARPIGAESIAVTDRLRAEAHRLLITPRRTLADLELVYDSAFGLADWELAESASGLWRFESNRSPASMTAHARILAARGHRTAAMRVLEAVLKRAPKCEEALWLRRDLDRK